MFVQHSSRALYALLTRTRSCCTRQPAKSRNRGSPQQTETLPEVQTTILCAVCCLCALCCKGGPRCEWTKGRPRCEWRILQPVTSKPGSNSSSIFKNAVELRRTESKKKKVLYSTKRKDTIDSRHSGQQAQGRFRKPSTAGHSIQQRQATRQPCTTSTHLTALLSIFRCEAPALAVDENTIGDLSRCAVSFLAQRPRSLASPKPSLQRKTQKQHRGHVYRGGVGQTVSRHARAG